MWLVCKGGRMSFIRRILVLLYVTTMMFLGVIIIFLVLGRIDVNNVAYALQHISSDETLKIVYGSLGGFLLVLNFVFYKKFSVNVRRGKNIAFDNPAGRVSVSLFALEDLIRRLIAKWVEVREVKVNVIASKKGLEAKIKLVLRSESNIPGLTSRIQDSVKEKIQDTIGLDEAVSVLVFIGKIIPEMGKEKPLKKKEAREESSEPNIPFRGYRA